ncbi:Serine carboxypeptidase F41C3.5 precursor [Aphelenchoides avenae]|nr:Serine carboxypeptidase F41C3.5 precursor [Aphelenchus avenae]
MINAIPTTLWESDVLNQYDLYRDCQSFKWNQSSTHLGPPYILGSMPSCTPDLASYLNSADVRKALHIPHFVAQWMECSETITNPAYQMSDDVYKEVSMLLANGVRVLLYYGDTDAVCNFLMGQKFPVQLGLKC